MNRKIILIIASIVLLASLSNLSAQADESKSAGYVYSGVGFNEGDNALFILGGGGETVLSNGLGLRADVGYLTFFEEFRAGVGTLSPGLFYEFAPQKKTSGFVGGGYTLFFREITFNGMHFGGGVRHWFSDSFGLRVEVRDEVFLEGETLHQILGRVSFLFR